MPEVTAGSNALVVAVIVIEFSVPAGAGPANGPHSLGRLAQPPAVTVPPGGV